MNINNKPLKKNVDFSWSNLLKKMSLISILMVFSHVSLRAMNEERENRKQIISPQPIHIVSSEGVAIVESIKAIAVICPKVARPIPMIESTEEFKIAKSYLGLSKKYGTLLSSVAVLGTKLEFIEQSQRVFRDSLLYIDALQGAPYKVFRSEEEAKELDTELYDINHRITQNHLLALTSMILIPPSQVNMQTAGDHVKEIKRIKEVISRNARYHKSLQEAIENAQSCIPGLIPLFNPEMKPQVQQLSKKPYSRIVQQKAVSQHKKMRSFAAKAIPESVFQESCDLQFHCTTHKILTEELSLSAKRIKGEAYVYHVQKLTDEYIALEQEGVKFRATMYDSTSLSASATLNAQELTELYRFFSKRYTLPHKNPLQLLGHIIITFIHANRAEEALIRTEVLRTLLLEKGELSDEFIAF